MSHSRRGFRGRGISDSQRRKKSWVQLVELVDLAEVPGFVTSIGLFLTDSGVPGRGVQSGVIGISGDGTAGAPFRSVLPPESTILRIRGSILFPKYLAAGGAAAANVDVAVGFGVTGISDLTSESYPGPISEADWDGWMFRRQSAVSPVDSEGTTVDVKAMRKIKSGDAFFVMMESVVGEGGTSTAVQTWAFDLRLLLLLP